MAAWRPVATRFSCRVGCRISPERRNCVRPRWDDDAQGWPNLHLTGTRVRLRLRSATRLPPLRSREHSRAFMRQPRVEGAVSSGAPARRPLRPRRDSLADCPFCLVAIARRVRRRVAMSIGGHAKRYSGWRRSRDCLRANEHSRCARFEWAAADRYGRVGASVVTGAASAVQGWLTRRCRPPAAAVTATAPSGWWLIRSTRTLARPGLLAASSSRANGTGDLCCAFGRSVCTWCRC
jgi:hypothetical protein